MKNIGEKKRMRVNREFVLRKDIQIYSKIKIFVKKDKKYMEVLGD